MRAAKIRFREKKPEILIIIPLILNIREAQVHPGTPQVNKCSFQIKLLLWSECVFPQI